MGSLEALKSIEDFIFANEYLFLHAFAPKCAKNLKSVWFSSSEVQLEYVAEGGRHVVDAIGVGVFDKWQQDILSASQDYLSGDALIRAANWLANDDNGPGSRCMAAIAMGRSDVALAAPSDAHDFGQCYRLLEAVPEIRQHFPRIARKVPAFASVLAHWDELCQIYWPGMTHEEKCALTQRLSELEHK